MRCCLYFAIPPMIGSKGKKNVLVWSNISLAQQVFDQNKIHYFSFRWQGLIKKHIMQLPQHGEYFLKDPEQ
jgi:hypothetical protein